jgi:DNA-binding NarL/FixJ family response regulator
MKRPVIRIVIGAADAPVPPALSDREFQVLGALVRGDTPARIAAELGLSTKTVSAHKVRVMRKLGVATTAELVRRGLEQRLVE